MLLQSQLLQNLGQEDQLRPGVQYQPGRHSKSPGGWVKEEEEKEEEEEEKEEGG
jgi:hypothetical protein